jgi:chlorophyll synthase
MLQPALPRPVVFWLAAAYSIGAHGIMTLNDFKSIDGDRASGIGSLPVRLGPERAAQLACATMLAAQAAVVLSLAAGGHGGHAALVFLLVLMQCPLMHRFLAAPRQRASWLSGVGVPLYVLGMLVSALAVRGAAA